jgi:UDP-4-amino-4-deoxy-L-arabinose formyltransferase/UDP-glucuronic acid dehydrogenase (UDP-4-keto-hexauronic acid decarboxylating)
LPNYCGRVKVPFSLENISTATLPFRPDIIASIHYRNLIKPNVIEACDSRIFNLHPSLLPDYRGCSSLTWALIDGESKAGFTFHYVDNGCDTGDILLQQVVKIEEFDTQATLVYRVMFEAMNHFETVFEMVSAGRAGKAQEGTGSYHRRGCPYGGVIPPEWREEKVERFIRAMTNPPLPVATFMGRPVHTIEEFRSLRSAWPDGMESRSTIRSGE